MAMISAARVSCPPSETGQSVPSIQVRYNARLRRRASARLEGGAILVELPASLSRERAQVVTERLVAGLLRRRATLTIGDESLAARAQVLADRYLNGVRARSVRWSPRQEHRWGSCSLPAGDIRVSERLRPAPDWVLDAVLVHELAHLQVAGHGSDFRALAARFPRQQEAATFLDGFALGISWEAGLQEDPLVTNAHEPLAAVGRTSPVGRPSDVEAVGPLCE